MKSLIGLFTLTVVILAACGTPAATLLPPTIAASPAVTSLPKVSATSTATETLPPRATATTLASPSSVPSETKPVATAPTAPPAPSPATSASPMPVVDASTLNGKVIFGYQGWFSCPTDGSKLGAWYHWTKRSKAFTTADLTVDYWPDMSQVPADERCTTGMTLPDGSPSQVFSSYNPKTVERHFQWMKQYGIDGVAAQRFVTGLDDARLFEFRNQVLANVRAGAENNGRVFYVEYDVTGKDAATLVASLKKDWTYLVDELKITESPRYLRDNGLPVLQIYGLGFNSHPDITADLGRQIVEYFKLTSPAKYHVTLMAGVPSYWRTGTHDANPDPAWAAVYRSFDVLSPWSVGRYKTDLDADKYQRDIITPDLAETSRGNQRYLPVVFPGFSWANLNHGPVNDIPRRCGAFYWHQVFDAAVAGSKMLFVAMFDEVDEGTAMFKLAPTKQQLPVGATLVPLDVDGCTLPSDWYLRLGGATGQVIRGEIKPTTDIPIKP